MNTRLNLSLGVAAIFWLAQSDLGAAGPWTQFRGSNHNSVSTENLRLNWAEEPPKILWKAGVPPGLSSITISDGRLFTMGKRTASGQTLEYCLALDANTGRELWATPIGQSWPGNYPNGGVGPDDGPRSTPAVEGNLVVAFGSYMNLVGLDATTGTRLWSRNLVAEYGAQVIAWQNAASPLILGDLVLVNGNGRAGEHLMAFRKTDGALVWKTGSDRMTHASPVAAMIAGVLQVVFYTQTGLVSVAPETGGILWRYAIPYNGTSVAASPVVAGDTVYASRAYVGGAAVVRISNNGQSLSAARVWEKPNVLSVMNHWATPVFHDGYYYGVYGYGILNLRCIDAANGDSKWAKSGVGFGSVTLVRDKLLVLSESGVLAVVEPTPAAYTELARFELPFEAEVVRCWNNPAISDGRIYLRSSLEAMALDLSTAKPAALLRLELFRGSNGGFRLEIAPQDGAALDASRAGNIGIYSTERLDSGTWTRFSGSTVLSSGKLLLESPDLGAAQRYFRATEGVGQ